ncbi:uncharacterized protein LOC112464098 [Temnothorax curvispinosus]|uniref:Uncharacterized protein LOC112464098 n=1 Tax=Temnothorax curvispinosus TaxID=300111 RepID=A0A6J1QXS0_9HYME|nr:uncharacterized protein LOC112464098 [Temnothorax curvispinosus]XP_024886659.1 uncharacterized protein LOC112464098 [Temnothorax curvispinosus]
MWARLAEAMGLEYKEEKIPNAYNMWFYATMCHVCKGFGDGVLLKKCGGCRMISYCGQEHQKEHWKLHKPLCKAIQDVLRDYSMDNPIITVSSSGETLENERKKSYFMLLISNKLGRPLKFEEGQMFCFPRECLICHERNAQSLKDCRKCVASFCKNHVNGTEHKNICAPLELRFRSDLSAIRGETGPPDMRCYLRHVTDKGKFQNMKDFINAYWNISSDSEISRNILIGQHSLHLTRPLTLFHAMRLLNYVPKSKAIVIHVVGACYSEEFCLMGWEVLPRLIGTAMPVTIIMIGPELQLQINPEYVCNNRMLPENKHLTFDFYDMLYENYVRSPTFVKPNLVVGFDLGIQEHELGSSKETWAPSIKLIAKQNCPFILTCRFRLENFKKELDRINAILGRKVNYLYSGENPFASLSPFRNVAPEYVLYMNQYIVIYRSLCL